MNGSPLYNQLLAQLKEASEEKYAEFHKRLLNDENINVLGVRVPTLKKLAVQYVKYIPEIFDIPDVYYEITFVKLQAVALLKYDDFIKYVDKCVSLIDNWATCDSFAPACIEKNKADFYKHVCRFLARGSEFYQRFALTTLLHYYVEEEWLDSIYNCISNHANTDYYYVHMAAAWLIAEILVKFYDRGVEFLKQNTLDVKTHNKAIQKACESYRLTNEQKDFLKGLKR